METGATVSFFEPEEALRPYIRYYYVLSCSQPLSTLTFPTGCPQIIFHRKKPLFIPELNRFQARFTISGQVNYPAHVESDGDTEMVVAVFYPHTCGMFIGTPPSAFYNSEIAGHDIGDRRLDDLAGRIFESSDPASAVRLLERWFAQQICDSLNIRRIGASLHRLLERPSTPVEALAETACLGPRQFGRVFRKCVGMNPKEYAGIARFQMVLRLMQLGAADLIGITFRAGYSDQSHFIRDFRRLAGSAPGQFLRRHIPYSDLYSNPPGQGIIFP